MYKRIGFGDFVDEFRNYGRQEQFTYDGLKALYDYLTEIEDGNGYEIELDVIELCTTYTEYTPEELVENFEDNLFFDDEDEDDFEDKLAEVIVYLEQETQVLACEDNDNLVVQDF